MNNPMSQIKRSKLFSFIYVNNVFKILLINIVSRYIEFKVQQPSSTELLSLDGRNMKYEYNYK